MRRYEEYTIQFDEIPARRTKWNVIYEMLDSLSLAVLLVMVLFAFVCRPFWVSGASMEPTLLDRNWVAVTTLGFHAQRGDIVVISQPNALNEPLIKRIIAVAGDTVEIDPPEGYVFVMGDNRNDSLDSRSSTIGFIDTRYLSGKAVFRLLPAGQWQIG